jgi:hypothetical protein
MSCEAISVPKETEFDVVITGDVHRYRVGGQLLNDETFTVRIVNEDLTERWFGNYGANYIDDLTQKAGCVKRLSVFWRMLVDGAKCKSPKLTLEVLTSEEMENLSHSKFGSESDDKLFLLLTHASDYDCFRFPLPVKFVPFSTQELLQTVSELYQDNKRLQRTLAATDCMAQVISIEKKFGELQALLKETQKRSNTKILALKKQVACLKGKLRKGDSN